MVLPMNTSAMRMIVNPPNTTIDCAAWKRTHGRLSMTKKMMPVIHPRT
jgi:hypothetical protein